MLINIKEKHTKQVLWAITIIILVTFGLGGAVSYIKGKQNPAIGKIGNKKIYAMDADYYDKMKQAAQVMILLNAKNPIVKSLESPREAGEYLLLKWKADKEKIKVSDAEIAKPIKVWFSIAGKFDKEAYDRFLNYGIHMQPSRFEEYVANFIKIDKLNSKLGDVKVTDEEVKDVFIRDTQKAKISYILFAQDGYLNTASTPTDQEMVSFYEENKAMFRKEPKAKFVYVSTDVSAKDMLNDNITNVKDIKQLAAKLNLEVKDSDLISKDDSIGDFGWQPILNQTAFALTKGVLSNVIEVSGKAVVVQKVDEVESQTPAMEEIKVDIIDALKQRSARMKLESDAGKILIDIKDGKVKSLRDVKLDKLWQYSETKEFRYNDYIEGIGLDLRLSGIALSLNEGQIHPEIINLPKGAYIIQLLTKTAFDQEKFDKTKEEYRNYLLQQNSYQAQEELLEKIKEESKFEIFELPKKSDGKKK